jgi:dephospho-CoA kinase
MPMRIVAVTGGIGTGKSTVSRLLAERWGCPRLDCDQEVHRLLRWPPVVREVGTLFPGTVTETGEVDRAALAGRVFAREDDRKRLEDLLHPLVRDRIQRWSEEETEANGARVGIVEVPLLYEVDFPLKRVVDVVVSCSERNQIERLRKRGGAEEGLRARIAAQWPLAEKMARADVVIWNEGGLGLLSRLVALAVDRIQPLIS